jgi:hypothetical protein
MHFYCYIVEFAPCLFHNTGFIKVVGGVLSLGRASFGLLMSNPLDVVHVANACDSLASVRQRCQRDSS